MLALSNVCISAVSPLTANGSVSLRGSGFCTIASTDGPAFSGSGFVSVERGTFAVKGDLDCPVRITGGSFKLYGSSSVAISNSAERAWCVAVDGLQAGCEVASITGLAGYDTSGIVADGTGSIYLWLPDGRHTFLVGAIEYSALVDGEDTKAVRSAHDNPTGVTVDGVDVSLGVGDGWLYDIATSNLLMSS